MVKFYSTKITIFIKSKENLRFRRLAPLLVPIDVCVMMHDEGTASDVTIGMWRHNEQVTNHKRNDDPWFLLPKQLSHTVYKSCYAVEWMLLRKYVQVMPWNLKKLPIINLNSTIISKRCVFGLVTWPWRLPEEWPEACGSLTMVGAGTMHGFGTDPIRNLIIWCAESQDQVN